ncbi:hypothetical protein AAG565_09355 [Fontimonas sp. SYSU GA230001]|uniref:hypothetical protein n=1 Tax=Fontimonas sp. SYSU GA230001 TaxID=3142450 RepID=UPI0032B574EA
MNARICVLCTLLLAACAAPAPKEAVPDTATAQNVSPNCLQQTGSHLQRSEDRPCVAAPGQVITREDIDRSGATTTSEALRKLSPAVR